MADQTDLRRTLAALRSDVPMRPEWRTRVMREIDRLPRPAADAVIVEQPPSRRSWTIRPGAAIAAGLLCAAVGGTLALGVDRLVRDRQPVQPIVATTLDAQGAAPVRFVFIAPEASKVAIVGDFNGWSPTGTAMRRSAGGLWSIDLPLAAGRHTYAFVVDGMLVRDPNALDSADDDYGVPSSVVLVSESKRT